MDIPDFKTCKVIKIEFNKQIIDRWDSKIDFRGGKGAGSFFTAYSGSGELCVPRSL